MSSRFTLRTAALASGVATASVTLLASTLTPVQAAPFSELDLDPYAGSFPIGVCTQTSPAIVNPTAVPMTPNGPAAASEATATSSYENNADTTDTVTQTTKIALKSRATAVGNRPTSIALEATGTASQTASKPASACTPVTYVGARTNFVFTITEPTWASYSMARKGPMYTNVYFYIDNAETYIDAYGRDVDGTTTGMYLLQPGEYDGYLEAEVRTRINTTSARKAKASVSLKFTPAGSASAKPSGKASPYVTLPAARSCATHDATAKVTGKAKRAKKIASITYTVNGKKGATLKGSKVTKSKATSLKIADDKSAKIQATVKLKNGKKLTTKASYLACTA
ncbi:hypothetical protein ACLM5J_00900 [Nocardioides sp. Bht2]|uniref:hypothetical protein n=1 Tax=Nocardioides sp. Bht2 TaxID=3392297 RepID=UPI0039B3763A